MNVRRRMAIVEAALGTAMVLNVVALALALTDRAGAAQWLAAGVTILVLEKFGARRYVYGRKVVQCGQCDEQFVIRPPGAEWRNVDAARLAYEVHWIKAHAREAAVTGGPMANVPGTDRWTPAVPEPMLVRERERADW